MSESKEFVRNELRDHMYEAILLEAVNNAKDNEPLNFTEVELLEHIYKASKNDKQALMNFKSMAKDYIKEYGSLNNNGLVSEYINHIISIIDDVIDSID